MTSRYLWTFGFDYATRVTTDTEGEEPFVSVYASTYDKAVKKVLKLKIPNIDSDENLKYLSCQEEFDVEDEEDTTVVKN